MRDISINKSENAYLNAFRMAWPAILESFFTALAGLIDSYMVSSLGSSVVAAVGLTTQPKFISLSFFFATSTAVSALIARRKGEGNQANANRIMSTALALSIVAALILTAIFAGFASQIMHFCGSTVETHDDAVLYYRILMLGLIFNAFQIVINAGQRGSGNTKISMTTNITSSCVNILFNYLLIGGHWGFPALGVRGAAIATVFGTFVASVMSVLSMMRKDSYIRIKQIINEKLWPRLRELKDIIHLGYSLFVEQILMRIGFLLTAIMAADKGTDAMAAHQVGMNLLGLSFSFGDGLQAAAVALIGYNLGRKDPDKARLYGKVCQQMGFIIAFVLAFVYFFGSRPLMQMFFREEEIVTIGVGIMRMCIVVLFFQIMQVIYMGCLRGAGDTLYTAVASMVSVTIVRTLGSYVFGYMLNLGILGIWVGIIADQFSRFTFSFIRFRQGKWVNIRI